MSSSSQPHRVKSKTFTLHLDSDVLELFGRYGRRFYFDQATIGSTRILTLLHGLGRKWSLFYEGLLETMLSESLEGEGMLETLLSRRLKGIELSKIGL